MSTTKKSAVTKSSTVKTPAKKTPAKTSAAPLKMPTKKTAPIKVASAETQKLVDQQVAMLKKGSNRIVMPPIKDAKVAGEKTSASGPSKMSVATELYNKHKAEGRKVVLAAFINEAKLTKAGANTYFANLKKKLG